MPGENEDIEIEIEDAEGDSASTESEAAPEAVERPKQVAEGAEKGIDALKQLIEEERRGKVAAEAGRLAAEQRAAQREQEVTLYKGQAESTQEVAINSAIHAAKNEADRLADEAQRASEEGDFKKATELTRKLARAESRLQQIEDAKALLEQKKKQAASAPANADPFESALSRFTPKTQAWLRAHPDAVTDTKTSHLAAAAHSEAMANGLAADSDAYFEFVEKKLYGTEDAKPQRKVSVAAPVTKTVPGAGASASGGRRVVSAVAARTARELGMDLKEYLKQHDRLVREGRMTALTPV